MTVPAGALRDRVTFRRRAADTSGERLGDWEVDTAFDMAARLAWIRGGEQTLQGRLQGVQPFVATVRTCAATRALDNGWSLLNARTGEAFNIQAIEPTKGAERAFLDVLATRDGSSGG